MFIRVVKLGISKGTDWFLESENPAYSVGFISQPLSLSFQADISWQQLNVDK